jgi:hypothetical protein
MPSGSYLAAHQQQQPDIESESNRPREAVEMLLLPVLNRGFIEDLSYQPWSVLAMAIAGRSRNMQPDTVRDGTA